MPWSTTNYPQGISSSRCHHPQEKFKELQSGAHNPYFLSIKLMIANEQYSGGGIGGLTLAAVLNKNSNVNVDIYEAKPVISTIGAGIAIWKRTWQILQELGLEDEMTKRKLRLPQEGESRSLRHVVPSHCNVKISVIVRGPTFRKADQPDHGFDFHSHMMPCKRLPVPVIGCSWENCYT